MNVAVFGAGLMGHALALVYAIGGHTIRMTDNNPDTLGRSFASMQTALATLRDGGRSMRPGPTRGSPRR
jgi:3-hydroxybutyryl-CoA dehydrogenase